jgi:hypothetical protein
VACVKETNIENGCSMQSSIRGLNALRYPRALHLRTLGARIGTVLINHE